MSTATTTHGGQIICRRCGFTHEDGNYDTCPRWEPPEPWQPADDEAAATKARVLAARKARQPKSRLQLAQERCRDALTDYHSAMAPENVPSLDWYPSMLGIMVARLEILLDTL